MLKSNSKKARENVRKYIVDNFIGYSYDIETPETFEETAAIIWKTFWTEKAEHDRRRMSRQELFIDWLSGLPSIFDSCYYYNRSAVDDLGGILEETETEKARFNEAKAEHMLSYLIYSEITKAVEKQQKNEVETLKKQVNSLKHKTVAAV